MRKTHTFLIVLLLASAAAAWLFVSRDEKKPLPVLPVSKMEANRLEEHSAIFEKSLVKVTDGIYAAIGYGLANSIMIEGTDGLIIVDTMTTVEEGRAVLEAFRTISNKPISAVIYTHNHADHVFGTEAFMADRPEIYAHESTMPLVMETVSTMRHIIGSRSTRMFGNLLAREDAVNSGIGPFLGITPGSTFGFVPPTKTFSDVLEQTISGVKIKLIHTPGETDDHVTVYLPDKRALICGDNFYWTFPNLYTIRGTPFRSLKNWYRSLDRVRELSPDYLVPCHTRPIAGRERIERILTDYRDAIQFVHDQAIRGMNMGLLPDELVEHVTLPAHLADAPYLQPFYGKVSWSVRSMFSGNLGWFDGDSASLQPISRRERANLTARLAGGKERVLAFAEKLAEEGQWQASLEITSELLQLEPQSDPIKKLRVKALVALAAVEGNPNARHYYLTEAMELREGFVARVESRPTPQTVAGMPLPDIIEAMAVNLDPKAAGNVDLLVGLSFPETGEAYTLHVRRGVAEVRRRDPAQMASMPLDIAVIANAQLFKEMLAGLRNPLLTILRFEYDKGNSVAFAKFMKMFAPPGMKLPAMPRMDS